MRYIIAYAACPMHWASKMQTKRVFSSTEAEYIALSQVKREVLPIMQLLEESREKGIPMLQKKPQIICTVFEDNPGAIEIATAPMMRPRTKHLNIKYHHFKEEVKKGIISIHYVPTYEQIADIFTKALAEGLFWKMRKKMVGW
jgi:hypothetical protein